MYRKYWMDENRVKLWIENIWKCTANLRNHFFWMEYVLYVQNMSPMTDLKSILARIDRVVPDTLTSVMESLDIRLNKDNFTSSGMTGL